MFWEDLGKGTASQFAEKVTNVRIAVEERPFRAVCSFKSPRALAPVGRKLRMLSSPSHLVTFSKPAYTETVKEVSVRVTGR